MRKVEIVDSMAPCPICGRKSRWHCKRTTYPADLGGVIELVKTVHHCEKCDHYFTTPRARAFVADSGQYTQRYKALALELAAKWRNARIVRDKLWRRGSVTPSISTICDWVADSDLPPCLWSCYHRAAQAQA